MTQARTEAFKKGLEAINALDEKVTSARYFVELASDKAYKVLDAAAGYLTAALDEAVQAEDSPFDNVKATATEGKPLTRQAKIDYIKETLARDYGTVGSWADQEKVDAISDFSVDSAYRALVIVTEAKNKAKDKA